MSGRGAVVPLMLGLLLSGCGGERPAQTRPPALPAPPLAPLDGDIEMAANHVSFVTLFIRRLKNNALFLCLYAISSVSLCTFLCPYALLAPSMSLCAAYALVSLCSEPLSMLLLCPHAIAHACSTHSLCLADIFFGFFRVSPLKGI